MTTMTLSQRLFDTNSNLMKKTLMVAAGVCALSISAKLQFPAGFWLPGTLQLLVVLVIGTAYGAKMAGITLLGYLALGATGAPVFAYGGGLPYFAGPTGGYLFGFLFGAIAVGAMAERGMDRNVITTAIAMTVGVLICHAFGSGWLLILARPEDAISWFKGFILFDLAKVVVAIIAFPTIWKAIGEQR